MISVYLHLGSDVSVYSGDVVGIFDYKLVNTSSFKEFLDAAQWNNHVLKIEGKPKSVVITNKNIFLAPVSRSTLARRWKKHTKPLLSGIELGV